MENQLKPSRFNIMTQIDSNRFVVANTLTGALISVDKNEKDALDWLFNKEALYKDTLPTKLLSILFENGYLIPYSMDELAILARRHWKARNSPKALGLAVALTLQCNFSCVYCYQEQDRSHTKHAQPAESRGCHQESLLRS